MKSKIEKVVPLTDTPFVRLYQLEAVNKKGRKHLYYLASRTMEEENLKLRRTGRRRTGRHLCDRCTGTDCAGAPVPLYD